MFEGIYLWDAKHGTPKRNASREEVADFIDKLAEQPNEVNHNIYQFTRFFDDFVKEASEFYEEPAITDYIGMSDYDKNEPVELLYYFDELAQEIPEHYWAVILKGAQINNLVVYHTISEQLKDPKNTKQTTEGFAIWKRHLNKLKTKEKERELSLSKKTKPLNPNELPETLMYADKTKHPNMVS